MSKMQQIFEAVMRGKGYTDFTQTPAGRYKAAAVQVRWSYFQMGWEMRGAMQ
jgi:hypothetical protein